MLGFHPEHDGFVIDPCIPKEWKQVTGMRRFRGDIYEIEIINETGSCKGVKQLWLDGVKMTSNALSLAGDGKVHSIRVIL
jgi:cellobiose phosphorylase